MRASLSIALLASAAVLTGVFAGCDADQAGMAPAETTRSSELGLDAEPATEAKPACVPIDDSHATCGLAPPNRRTEGGTALKVTTVAGESFWVVLPDELASGVVAVPRVPIRVNTVMTTAPPREAADYYCHGFRRCRPIVVKRMAVPSGVMTRWDDASESIHDLAVTTVDLGLWTLVMLDLDAFHAERLARALRWSVDEDGFPHLVSVDREVRVDVDWAGAGLSVPALQARDEHYLIEIVPGCELSTKDPDLGGSDAGPDLELHPPDTVAGGSWCVDGRYHVDVAFAERPELERFHQTLRIVPAAQFELGDPPDGAPRQPRPADPQR